MKYDVTFTEQAENDLRGIFEYIAFDLLSPENAAGQLDRIEEKILSLGEYPEKFRQYEREPWKSRNTRVVPVDNYVIFYITDKTKKLVTVIRVLYTSPNYLLGMEEYEEDLLEIITVYKNLKDSKTKEIALEQMKLLATIHPAF